MEKISVVINTYNAEKYLERVINSVKDFNEVLVCDMESTDNTINIALTNGCRVITFPKNQHTIVEPARNYAIQHASHSWVLVVDADELITQQLHDFLVSFVSKPASVKGLRIPRKNYLMNCFMHGYYPDYNLRFFRKEVTFWPPVIHAQPIVQGKVERVPFNNMNLAIIHLDDRSIKDRLAKINHYTEHEIFKRAHRNYGWGAFFYRPFVRFIKCYVFKGGFRDGVPGLIFAGLELVQQFVILAKHYENKHYSV